MLFPLRDENPVHHTPWVTILLIVANILAFFYEVTLPPGLQERFIETFAAIPALIVDPSAGGAYLSVVTCMFLHGGLMHLLGNMWFLWLYGDNIEDFLGPFLYLAFYLVTGIVATLTHVFFNATSAIPLVGASGAISGVMGAYIYLHPQIRIRSVVTLGFYFTTVYVPAYVLLGLWFVMQIFGGFAAGGQVAYGAHLGGFLAGIPLIMALSSADRRPHRRYEPSRTRRW